MPKLILYVRRQKGFTTVELIITVVLVSILTIAIFAVASAMRRSFAQNTKNNYNLLAAKKGLSRIAEELRYATNMSNPNLNNSESDNAAFVVGNVSTTITLEKTTLKIKKGPTSILTVPFINDLNFKRDKSWVKVTMTVQDKSSSGATNPTLKMSTTVRMLNVSE